MAKKENLGNRHGILWLGTPKFKNGKNVEKYGVEGILANGILEGAEVGLKVIKVISLDTSTCFEAMVVVIVVGKWLDRI